MDKNVSKEYLEDFVEMKGLTTEYEEFARTKQREHDDEMAKVSVGDLPFDFYGYLSKGCYECSGYNFDDGCPLNYFLQEFFSLNTFDPKTTDKYDLEDYKMKNDKYRPITEVLSEEELFDNIMSFIEQDSSNVKLTWYRRLCSKIKSLFRKKREDKAVEL